VQLFFLISVNELCCKSGCKYKNICLNPATVFIKNFKLFIEIVFSKAAANIEGIFRYTIPLVKIIFRYTYILYKGVRPFMKYLTEYLIFVHHFIRGAKY
jgi:hypothetical protein